MEGVLVAGGIHVDDRASACEVELALRRVTRTRRVLEKRSIRQSTRSWLVADW